jgi:hypothetical protein
MQLLYRLGKTLNGAVLYQGTTLEAAEKVVVTAFL